MTDLVTRFAPSPTGYLHLGHAYSALVGYEAARAAGGRFLLRIEDIDHTRCRPAFEAAIYDDLAWLGVAWETPVRRQSDHLSDYRAALDRLRDRGLLYRCFRTRKAALDEIGRAPHQPPAALTPGPLPPGEEAQKLAQGAPFAWRLSLDRARDALGGFDGLGFEEVGEGPNGERGWIAPDPTTEGDVVLARKDLGVAYHLAVVVDDAAQGVTQVTRGADLFAATGIQRLLQALLNLPAPTSYRHHPLLLGPDGKRLAKRNGGESLRDLRAAGVTAAEVRRRVGLGDKEPC
jgi:glutamyl-Q tRNA(Asp) synthetase